MIKNFNYILCIHMLLLCLFRLDKMVYNIAGYPPPVVS